MSIFRTSAFSTSCARGCASEQPRCRAIRKSLRSNWRKSTQFGSLLLADLGVLALAVPVGLLGGSLTIKAETIRFVLGMSIEIFAYTVMWRLHRDKLHDLEFGGGKLEQIANLVTGVGMLGGAAWIASKAMAIVSGHGEVGAPLGLALAAIVGALNAYINFVAWDAMRRAAVGTQASSCKANCRRDG